jgi:hypothetical protein
MQAVGPDLPDPALASPGHGLDEVVLAPDLDHRVVGEHVDQLGLEGVAGTWVRARVTVSNTGKRSRPPQSEMADGASTYARRRDPVPWLDESKSRG